MLVLLRVSVGKRRSYRLDLMLKLVLGSRKILSRIGFTCFPRSVHCSYSIFEVYDATTS